MSERIDTVLGRFGYVRRDPAGKELAVPAEASPEPVEDSLYPQVIVVQGRSDGESWVGDHAGQVLVAVGVGVLALTGLALVALVAVVVALTVVAVVLGMVTCAAALAIATAAVSQSARGGRR